MATTKAKAKPSRRPKPPRTPKAPPALPSGCEALLTRAQVCVALSVSLRTLTGMVSAGAFPKPDATVGARPRWRVGTLNAWIEGRCRGGGLQAGER